MSGRTKLCLERQIVRLRAKIDIQRTNHSLARRFVRSNTLSPVLRFPRPRIYTNVWQAS